MSDEIEPTSEPIASYEGAAGTARVYAVENPEGYQVWFGGEFIEEFGSEAAAIALAKKLAEFGFGNDEETSTPAPSPFT